MAAVGARLRLGLRLPALHLLRASGLLHRRSLSPVGRQHRGCDQAHLGARLPAGWRHHVPLCPASVGTVARLHRRLAVCLCPLPLRRHLRQSSAGRIHRLCPLPLGAIQLLAPARTGGTTTPGVGGPQLRADPPHPQRHHRLLSPGVGGSGPVLAPPDLAPRQASALASSPVCIRRRPAGSGPRRHLPAACPGRKRLHRSAISGSPTPTTTPPSTSSPTNCSASSGALDTPCPVPKTA